MIYFLSLILALLPTYQIRFHIFGLPTTFLEILIVAFLLTVVGQFIGQKKLINQLTILKNLGKINYAIGLFVLAAIIATIVSPEKAKALGQLKAFFLEPILFFYAAILVLKTDEDKKIALKWLLNSAFVISLFGFIQYFTFLHLPIRFWGTGNETLRITSVFDYPNALALYLTPLFGLFGMLWLQRYKLLSRGWDLFCVILIGIALILTFSRGAWFAIFLAFLWFFLQKYDWKKVLGALAIIILVLFLVPQTAGRIKLGLSDPSSTAHFDLMTIGVNKILSDPFLGNGLLGFRTTLEQAHFGGEILNYPHNIFLNFWLELGLLGLISFALIIFFVSQQHKKQPKILTLAAAMFLLVMILHGLVDVPYFKNDLSILFWFMIAVFYI